MTAFAMNRYHGLMTGVSATPAGNRSRDTTRRTVAALTDLKIGTAASSSWVFNDLRNLAEEHNIDYTTSQVFMLAQRFLLTFPGHFPAPELSLDSDGEVVFDWIGSRGGMVTATLRDDGRISFAARFSALDKDYGTKEFVDAIPKQVIDLVEKVSRR